MIDQRGVAGDAALRARRRLQFFDALEGKDDACIAPKGFNDIEIVEAVRKEALRVGGADMVALEKAFEGDFPIRRLSARTARIDALIGCDEIGNVSER